MGYMTVISILNDGFENIKRNKERINKENRRVKYGI